MFSINSTTWLNLLWFFLSTTEKHKGNESSWKSYGLCDWNTSFNPLTPNDPYSGRTAPLNSKLCILYIYSTNIGTAYLKHGIYSPFFPLQNAVYFIILTFGSCIIHIFYTYLLTPWCRVLLEKLTCLQLLKKFPAFHGTRKFITTHISARYLSLS